MRNLVLEHDLSNFEEISKLVSRDYYLLRQENPNLNGKKLRDALFSLLKTIYSKYQHFESFAFFESEEDFKFKILKFFSKNKNTKKPTPSFSKILIDYQKEAEQRVREEEYMLELLARDDW